MNEDEKKYERLIRRTSWVAIVNATLLVPVSLMLVLSSIPHILTIRFACGLCGSAYVISQFQVFKGFYGNTPFNSAESKYLKRRLTLCMLLTAFFCALAIMSFSLYSFSYGKADPNADSGPLLIPFGLLVYLFNGLGVFISLTVLFINVATFIYNRAVLKLIRIAAIER
jgi:hypothetical protein